MFSHSYNTSNSWICLVDYLAYSYTELRVMILRKSFENIDVSGWKIGENVVHMQILSCGVEMDAATLCLSNSCFFFIVAFSMKHMKLPNKSINLTLI